jgi:excisionase family DNA binding protein
MGRERRSPESAERRHTHTHGPSARAVSFDVHRLGRRIGPAWLTVSQLCRRWQLDRKTIYKFIDAKILPAWKVGEHLYRVAVEDVLHFEAVNKLSPVLSERRFSLPAKD